jgi:hypothetical protein
MRHADDSHDRLSANPTGVDGGVAPPDPPLYARSHQKSHQTPRYGTKGCRLWFRNHPGFTSVVANASGNLPMRRGHLALQSASQGCHACCCCMVWVCVASLCTGTARISTILKLVRTHRAHHRRNMTSLSIGERPLVRFPPFSPVPYDSASLRDSSEAN